MAVPADINFRRHTRLRGFDYRESHAYFVTICVRHRECVFSSVTDGSIVLSRRGMVARDCWVDIANHHPHIELDAFVIMPNHMHGILLFVGDASENSSVVATPASRPSHATGPSRGSLGAVVGSYKAAVTRSINRLRPGAGNDLWQPNYYEHIIRDDRARDRIRDYIDLNPDRWSHDLENPNGDGTDDVAAFARLLAEDSPLRGDRDAGVAPTNEGI
jgi:putative transposase